MKFLNIPSLLTLTLATLLAACGGADPATDMAFQAAPVMEKVDVAANQAAPAQHPTPDCAPEGCNGLRIIDGNAEAYRLDAMRRAATEENDPLPQA